MLLQLHSSIQSCTTHLSQEEESQLQSKKQKEKRKKERKRTHSVNEALIFNFKWSESIIK